MDKNEVRARTGETGERKKLPVYVKYGIVMVAVLALIAAGLVIYFSVAGSYVATVDGEKIGTGEFKYYLEVEKQNMFGSAQQADPKLTQETFWKTKIGGEDAIDVAKKKALDGLRDVKIEYIKAKENKISLTSAEIKTIDDSIKQNIIDPMGNGNKLQANKAMQQQYGFSLDDLRSAQIEKSTVQKFQYSEIGKTKITDADIKTYYDKNPDWYKKSSMRQNGEEAVWVRHILIKFPDNATQADKDAAKKKAEDILAKAKAGEDFATLAKENSQDSNAPYGGSYVFTKGVMVKEFEDAAFSLSPGQIYDTPVQTQFGYHIIKLEEKIAKDQPVSLKCATDDTMDFGTTYIQGMLYQQKLDGWKKDPKYNTKINNASYNSVK